MAQTITRSVKASTPPCLVASEDEEEPHQEEPWVGSEW